MEQIFQFIEQNIDMIFLLMLAILLGFELIGRVPTVLHTPLMSGTNAISGVVTVGGILLLRSLAPDSYFLLALGAVAVMLGMINIVGGYKVTDRMLGMFKKKKA